jgi:hypothetical protein
MGSKLYFVFMLPCGLLVWGRMKSWVHIKTGVYWEHALGIAWRVVRCVCGCSNIACTLSMLTSTALLRSSAVLCASTARCLFAWLLCQGVVVRCCLAQVWRCIVGRASVLDTSAYDAVRGHVPIPG